MQLTQVDGETVGSLPVDHLGLLVLEDLIVTNQWNTESYLSLLRRDHPSAKVIIEPVMEAIAWLLARGLIMRDQTQPAAGAFRVTREGRRVHQDGSASFYATERLQGGLHPSIEGVARPQFLIGQYEMGVFAAMKKVETRVRALGGYAEGDVGVSLMNRAFSSNGGPLTDPNQVPGEQEGTRALFAGTYAVFRNPSGHREVNFDDVSEAAEMVQTASLLMRILDRVEQRLGSHNP